MAKEPDPWCFHPAVYLPIKPHFTIHRDNWKPQSKKLPVKLNKPQQYSFTRVFEEYLSSCIWHPEFSSKVSLEVLSELKA